MKRIGLIIACMSLFMLLSGTVVWAAGVTISDGVITLSDNATTTGLTYQMSPNVLMGYLNVDSVDGYVITSVNTKGSMAYGIQSGYTGYYQKVVTATQAATAPTATNATITGTDWTKVTF